eukprot:SAG22_NODE_20769_length_263_cov_0.536585_1_plen_30_part_10
MAGPSAVSSLAEGGCREATQATVPALALAH